MATVSRRAPLWRMRRQIVLAGWMLAWAGNRCFAQQAARTAEYRVKAAYLSQFLNYVEWPAQAFERADSPVVIGVMGADALAEELASVASERPEGRRPVLVRKFRPADSPSGLHMLFAARADATKVGPMLASIGAQPLLVVTESDDGLAMGSAINFVIVDNKVRFDIALSPAAARNLKISSRLLSVARRVVSS